jgi:hypothetical protein
MMEPFLSTGRKPKQCNRFHLPVGGGYCQEKYIPKIRVIGPFWRNKRVFAIERERFLTSIVQYFT